MLKNNKVKVIAATAAILGATTLGALAVSADATSTNTTQNPRQNFVSGLVKAIATKFNLNEADVQTVVDAQEKINREQIQANMEARFAERLAQAVTDSKLTQAQADLIKTKHAEIEGQLQTLRDSLKDKTPAERQAAIKTQMDALKTWATQNNIPLEYLGPGVGMGMERGMMGHDGRGPGHFGGRFGSRGFNDGDADDVAPTQATPSPTTTN